MGLRMSRCPSVIVCAAYQEEAATKLQDSDAFPILRSFENDLCVLELMGDATAGEALAALASDGGRTAEQELASGKSLMTIDVTVSGTVGERNTVSTRILAPTRQVAERARSDRKKKKGKRAGDGAFRTLEFVLMRQVLRFELQMRRPGHVREVGKEMGPSETETRMVSSDAKVLDALAGAVSSHAVACMKEYTTEKVQKGRWIPRFWSGEKWSPGRASPVRLRMLSTSEVSALVKGLELPPPEARREGEIVRESHDWWPLHSGASTALGHVENAWVREYVPVHMLQIDLGMVEIEVEGWDKTGANRVCTLLLTHAQMVELANVLDCYYADVFTGPDKKLVTHIDLKVPFGARSRLMLAATMAVAAFFVGCAVLVGCLVAARLNRINLPPVDGSSMPSALSAFTNRKSKSSAKRKLYLPINEELPVKEMEVLCRVVVAMIKDGVGWTEEIQSRAGEGAWMGADLTQWVKPDDKDLVNAPTETSSQQGESNLPGEEATDNSGDTALSFISGDTRLADDWESPPPLEKVLRYQVVLSRDGEVIGFSPLNIAAIRMWAQLPLAEALHKGKKVKASLFERVPKYNGPPEDAVVIELLYRDNDDGASSVTARPFKT